MRWADVWVLIRWALRWTLLLAAPVALAATVVPVWPTNTWWVRVLDYPRLQMLAAMFLALTVLVVLVRRGWAVWLASGCYAVACVWNVVLLSPYLLPPVFGWPAAEVAAGTCGTDRRLRVLAANVQMSNAHDDRLLKLVRAADPDVAWFQETDQWWEDRLSTLSDAMPYGLAKAQPNYFGVHLFSKWPLEDAGVRYYTKSRNPSVAATVTLPGGEKVRLYAIHPRPPQIGQSTAERDAQMMAAALDAYDTTLPHVLLGDLNAVPWEDMLRRLREVGGFHDPRWGRGLLISWNAQSTTWKWPLDHILTGPAFELVSLEVLGPFGSDHYPMVATLCLAPGPVRERRPGVPVSELQAAREVVARGQDKADEPGSRTPPGSEVKEED